MDKKTQDELLLYWSGEADAALSAEIETLVETNLEAREYLDELGALNALRDELAELPAMNPSRSFAAEGVAEKKATRFPLPWIYAAAAVIAMIAVGIKSWPTEKKSVFAEETKPSNESVAEEPASRPKLSQRLFSSRHRDPAIERISIARERARKLRTELSHLRAS